MASSLPAGDRRVMPLLVEDRPGKSGKADRPTIRDAFLSPEISTPPLCAPVPSRPIGYFTNVYPHVSHSFIRREIMALEARGISIVRFSIRRSPGPLPDIEDQSEQARTTILLEAGIGALVGATLLALMTRPVRFGRAVRLTIGMGRASAPGVLRHMIYLLEACLLTRRARQCGIRHIHTHFGTNPAAVARLARTLHDISYSMTIHGPDEFDAPIALSLSQKIADAAFVVAISHHGSGQLMRWSNPDDWSKIRVVRCGLDQGFLVRREARRSPEKSTSQVFVCIARLDAQKGISVLVEAARLLGPDLDFKLRIIGDGAMRAELARRIVDFGLSDRVILLGWQSAAEIRTELEGARALVLSSFAEGLPVVLMEAMALERPVIATAIAGIPELVDAACGWVVPAGSADAIAAAMRLALLADTKTLQAMGAIGRLRVMAQHDAATNAAELAEMLVAHA
jgi:colanic acid/amylovoran biosynthesis glycosyltransferase